MIYVATVHFQSPKWIDVQQAYLRRHISQPFKTFAVLEGISRQHHDAFDCVIASKGTHEGHLNLLAAEIGAVADPADILVFLMATPFLSPIPGRRSQAPCVTHKCSPYGGTKITAIGNPILASAPSKSKSGSGSTATGAPATNGRTIRGGRRATSAATFGNCRTEQFRLDPLLRTNKRNDHPLWFAVYGDIIYHHGAGFRRPFSRVDEQMRPEGVRGGRIPLWHDIAIKLTARRRRIWTEKVMRSNEELSEQWFERLKNDPDFYRELTQP